MKHYQKKKKKTSNQRDSNLILGLLCHWWGQLIHQLMLIFVVFVLSLSIFQLDSFIPEAGYSYLQLNCLLNSLQTSLFNFPILLLFKLSNELKMDNYWLCSYSNKSYTTFWQLQKQGWLFWAFFVYTLQKQGQRCIFVSLFISQQFLNGRQNHSVLRMS